MIKKNKFYLFLVIFILIITLCSCVKHPVDEEDIQNTENTTYLNLSVTVSPNDGCTIIPAQDISSSFPIDLKIYNLSNIAINIDGIETPLVNAFQQELVTPEEIFAFAQIDTRKGNCDMESISIQGLTYHIFTYPKFDLAVVYDILETPDGKQHLIHTMSFDMAYRCKPEDEQIIYTDDITGKALDRENWGLTLDTVEVAPTGITVSCTQEGGQQFGQLDIDEFLLYSYESNGLLGGFNKIENGTIQMNAASDIVIDWTTSHGELSPGTYFIRLYMKDNYDPSVIHPLTKNYYDTQSYDIEFTIQ